MPNHVMSMLSRHLLAFGMAASCLASPLAAANNGIPTHCQEGEIAFLNARMYRVETNHAEKILSLCADRETEPLARMVYRFGAIGKVEMELVASAQNKAGVSRQSDTGSHTGLISIRFDKGPYAYEVSEGLGMTTGIRLDVYRHKKKIVGYESHEDESKLVVINFDQASSPIFMRTSPFQPW